MGCLIGGLDVHPTAPYRFGEKIFPACETASARCRCADTKPAREKSPATTRAEYHLLLKAADQSLLSGLNLLNVGVNR